MPANSRLASLPARALIALCVFWISPAWVQPQSHGAVQNAKGPLAGGGVAAGSSMRSALASGGQGPEMIALPAGTFAMGSPAGESGHRSDEGPVHSEHVRAFALARYPVTRAEFARFVAATGYLTDAEKDIPAKNSIDGQIWSNTGLPAGCWTYTGNPAFAWKPGSNWRNPGFAQSDRDPVVCVSWFDGLAYAAWLARQTGKRYRLPTEAEMEYAIRAGRQSPYPWGSDPEQACQHGNVADATARQRLPALATLACNDGAVFTTPVDRYPANALGLYDMAGNVFVWTQDCGKDNYDRAPIDGSAQQAFGCELRVFRGSSWMVSSPWLRSASRLRRPPADRCGDAGLRMAEDP